MLNNIDLRLIKPARRVETYKGEEREIFAIPCRVIEIGDRINGSAFEIFIERLDFGTGKLIKHKAITWEKTLDIFESRNLQTPFLTECKFYFTASNKPNFVVYGKFNTAGLLNLLQGDVNYTEEELNQKYNTNYIELREWIKSNR
jgi:hypothetical protein